MKVAVNDANILFDLIDLDLIHSLFKLDYTFCTTDLIINEFKDSRQMSVIQKFIDDGLLSVLAITDIRKISIALSAHPALSSQDCSVLITARETNAILLTGDGCLRKIAESESLEVHGILWIFDSLVAKGIITQKIAHSKLSHLISINNYLPESECRIRLNKWK